VSSAQGTGGPDASRAHLRTIQAFAFSAIVATALVVVGTRDFETYESAFVSLDRGTALPAASVAGQPVYTLALGLGTRLPLHGNLGASPAAAVARVLPAPVTHWLLLALSMAAGALVVLRALEPVSGRLVAWWSVALLFVSLPMVAYTVHNDWSETAVTYCALVGGMFAPHAWPGLRDGAATRRRLESVGLLALVASLLAMAHPGYWPQTAAAIGLSGLLLFARPAARPRDRWTALVAVGAATMAGAAIHLPDFAHELALGAGLGRDAQGPADSLIGPHLFPLFPPGSKDPFMLLALTLAALAAAAKGDRRSSALVVGCSIAALAFGVGAYLPPSWLTAGFFLPTASWTLRDPAGVFAVMSGAFAAAALRQTSPAWARKAIVAAMALASVQSLGYAGMLLRQAPAANFRPWNHDGADPGARPQVRGMPGQAAAGDRLALWPGVREEMRQAGRASTDWADAGQTLVTAWTKNRTAAHFVGPHGYLFDQAVDLPSELLCDAATVSFLRLRHLVVPPGQTCQGWVVSSARIDDRWTWATWVGGEDARVRAIPAASLTASLREDPALANGSTLMRLLMPQEDTVLEIDTARHVFRISGAGLEPDGRILVLPVAHDPGWRVSSGRTSAVGGLLAIAGWPAGEIGVWFAPDAGLRTRAVGMAVAQLLGIFGLLVLGFRS
jgi:hypothetical protein